MLMIIIVVGVVVWGMLFVYREKNKIFAKQWEEWQVSVFLEKINRCQSCSMEDYLKLVEVLNYSGVNTTISLEIYQKERYYLFSWEEIKLTLIQEPLKLEKGCLVRLCTESRGNSYTQKSVYKKVISGKG